MSGTKILTAGMPGGHANKKVVKLIGMTWKPGKQKSRSAKKSNAKSVHHLNDPAVVKAAGMVEDAMTNYNGVLLMTASLPTAKTVAVISPPTS